MNSEKVNIVNIGFDNNGNPIMRVTGDTKDMHLFRYKKDPKNLTRNYGSVFYPLFDMAKTSPEKVNPILNLKGKKILDVGCGSGQFCSDSVEIYGAKHAYGVDFASDASGFTHGAEGPKTTFFDAHAKDVPLETDSVDITTSFLVLEHTNEEDIEEMFEKLYNVTKEGWVFSIAHGERSATNLRGCGKPSKWCLSKMEKYIDEYCYYYPVTDQYKWGFGDEIGLSRFVCKLKKKK